MTTGAVTSSVDESLGDKRVCNVSRLLVLVGESSNEQSGKSGGTDGGIHSVVSVSLLSRELSSERDSETVLPPVLCVGEGVLKLVLECLVDLFEFSLVLLVELTHLSPKWHHVINVVLPGVLVHSINLLVHATLLLEPCLDGSLIEVEGESHWLTGLEHHWH